ncbi:MAG: outer membrane protein assembly factor [Arenimonas sp.]|nr:outer membrane protein assembly factor [Arenimonas sp.]
MPPAFANLLRLLALGLLLAATAGTAEAMELRTVTVQGLDDEEMRDNVEDALSLNRLNPNRRRNVSDSRLAYLLRQAPREARGALEPFGFYEPQVETRFVRDGEALDVTVTVVLGEPVRVHKLALVLTGEGETDSVLMRRLERFRPRVGEVFHHGVYEESKTAVSRSLSDRGYFDAELLRHRVEVTRAQRRADVDLAWTSGARYAFGDATFQGHQFRPGLLEKLVPWTPGDPFTQARLRTLQTSLVNLDYFAGIDIRPEPDAAQDLQVPVTVTLVPGKRTVYSAGVRYGTDTGLGVTGGIDRRWVNDRGHKTRTLVSLAERRNDATVQYKIPAFAWLDGWYSVSASVQQETLEFVDSELFEVVGSRSGKLGRWTLIAAMNFRRERYDDVSAGERLGYSTLVFPSLLAQWSDADGEFYPRRARALRAEISGGSDAAGSDINFVQLRAEGRWVLPAGEEDRVLLRAEAGTTSSNEFSQFPPSLRFYAGGDRSVRGYGYKEIGRFLLDPNGRRFVFGGKHLLVASAEYERMFTSEWGGAVFVDAGDAFDAFDRLTWQVGVGVGVRWRSPVGPVAVDVAHGFGENAQQSIRLHLNIGPKL